MRWYWVREDARAHAQSPQGVAKRNGFKPIPQVDSEAEFIQPIDTVIAIKQDLGDGNFQINKYIVPCTRDMLFEFAENVLTKNWTLGINTWERGDTLFSRDTYKPFRAWLLSNQFAASTGGGALALTSNGRAFLDAWLNKQSLPTEYQFGEVVA